jgi:hypothetical protein
MRHFSLNGRTVLLGKDEWLEPEVAEMRLDQERQRVQQLIDANRPEELKR